MPIPKLVNGVTIAIQNSPFAEVDSLSIWGDAAERKQRERSHGQIDSFGDDRVRQLVQNERREEQELQASAVSDVPRSSE